ncbi:MAG: transglycosylase SLT domain-containing protein [Alistipes sp.]|nr:transglycosylase SLT domain-containing protein [Alistipes sp.]
MKRLTALLLCCLLAAPAPALDRKPRNPRIDAQTAEPGNEPDEWQLEEPARTTARPQTAPTAEAAAENPVPATAPIEHRMPELTAEQADSLVAEWRERQRSQSFREFFDTYVLADSFPADSDVPDSVYTGRLRALASPIQLPYNGIVRNYINRYVAPGGSTIGRILGMSQYYFPLIEEELIKEGLPVELRALPIIESGLSSTAVSHAGAAGLWQFMPSTGRSYGLEVNSLVDERCDPILSTKAACRYLKDLYRIYKEWSLAIAAYNCGPGNVNKALARAGEESRSFWDIYDFLPRETRGYVPAFIGASYAYSYHRNHGIEPEAAPIPLSVDTLRINRLMHLGQIASTIDIPMETLRQLNPQYKIDIIPATTKTYTLVLPQRKIAQYIAHEQEIMAKDSMYLKEYINPANLDKKRQEYITIHTVKKGETLGAIAHKYHVTTTQLIRWNKLKNANRLSIGQKLRIERR